MNEWMKFLRTEKKINKPRKLENNKNMLDIKSDELQLKSVRTLVEQKSVKSNVVKLKYK